MKKLKLNKKKQIKFLFFTKKDIMKRLGHINEVMD